MCRSEHFVCQISVGVTEITNGFPTNRPFDNKHVLLLTISFWSLRLSALNIHNIFIPTRNTAIVNYGIPAATAELKLFLQILKFLLYKHRHKLPRHVYDSLQFESLLSFSGGHNIEDTIREICRRFGVFSCLLGAHCYIFLHGKTLRWKTQ